MIRILDTMELQERDHPLKEERRKAIKLTALKRFRLIIPVQCNAAIIGGKFKDIYEASDILKSQQLLDETHSHGRTFQQKVRENLLTPKCSLHQSYSYSISGLKHSKLKEKRTLIKRRESNSWIVPLSLLAKSRESLIVAPQKVGQVIGQGSFRDSVIECNREWSLKSSSQH